MIYDAIAQGGMATVHLGRLRGPAGFLRTVAIKRLHRQFAADPRFVGMLLDEARVAARVQHPNVISTIDVVVAEQELLIVMEYVRGDSLSSLLRVARERGIRPEPSIVVAILAGALHGLHAAHEAVNDKGQPLHLVHRDVSPQNILVGLDGTPRVLDFGVAKVEGATDSTKQGEIKGKMLYMSREQLGGEALTRVADVYAAGVVLYEALTTKRMFAGDGELTAISKILTNEVRMPSSSEPSLAPFDPIVRRATAVLPSERYPTALDMALELEAVAAPASAAKVGAWVRQLLGDVLDRRAAVVAEIERSTTRSSPPMQLAEERGIHSGTWRSASSPDWPNAPTVTGVSSAVQSAVESDPQRSRQRRSTASVVILGALLACSVSTIAFLLNRKPQLVPMQAAATPPPVASLLPMVASAPPFVPQATAASTAAIPSVVQSSTPQVTRSGGADSATRASTGGTRPGHCDPPYVVDKQGHKHFLPECVQ